MASSKIRVLIEPGIRTTKINFFLPGCNAEIVTHTNCFGFAMSPPTGASPDQNSEAAHPACHKRQLLTTLRRQSALLRLLVGLFS